MEIWTIEDGDKRGPFHDIEVRRRIADGELGPETPVWHDGLDDWTALAEIPVFAAELEAATRKDEPESEVMPPPLPEEMRGPVAKPTFVRRFWARWFDLIGFTALWWFALWLAGRDIRGILNSGWIMLFQLVPWFMLEAWLIHRWGRTPGKWLLGIHVLNDDGSLLSLAESTRRAVRVMFLGVGLGWGAVALVCQAMSWFFARKLGRPLWDQAGGHRVDKDSMAPVKVLVFVGAFWGLMMLQWAVVSPFVVEQSIKTFPQLEEHYKKNPPVHFPVGGPWKK